jgi:hypothetical protein
MGSAHPAGIDQIFLSRLQARLSLELNRGGCNSDTDPTAGDSS